jgi:hypothetical protein
MIDELRGLERLTEDGRCGFEWRGPKWQKGEEHGKV